MNPISALIRIICGLALVIMSWSTYQRTSAEIGAGGHAQVLGFTLGASAGELTFAFGVIGLVGLGLIILGVCGFLKGRE